MDRCVVIGAGDLTVGTLPLREDDYIIAVDGGLQYCGILGVEPDLVLGDFDSLGQEGEAAVRALEQEIPERIIRLDPVKDDTDMLYALKTGLKLGKKEFLIYGGTGGRFDHTLANLQCLLYLKNRGAVGYLMDGEGMMLVLKNETVRFQRSMEGRLSLFSLGAAAKGVCIKGMKYPLQDYTMTNDFPIGISNEFIGEEAEVSVADGELACVIGYACTEDDFSV